MKPGFNATRRSRNIGTAKQGHGRNNRLTIPRHGHDERAWFAQLGTHQRIERGVGGRNFTFFVEETTGAFVHCCSVEDICRLLQMIPKSDLAGMRLFVLRQPRRKERILAPVWGRMSYWAQLGRPGHPTIASGPAIFIEAFDPNQTFEWPTSLTPEDQKELARLEADGHGVERASGRIVFTPTRESIRNTQLYRTLPHEIGHWTDWLQKVEEPAARAPGRRCEFEGAYCSRPNDEREAFAHRYTDATRERLVRFGLIPFDHQPDEDSYGHPTSDAGNA